MVKKRILIVSGIVITLLVLLAIYKSTNKDILNLRASNFTKAVESNNFSLVYYGETNDDIEDKLKKLKSDYNIQVYTSNVSQSEYKKLFGVDTGTPLFDFFIDGELIYTVEDSISDDDLGKAINKYFYNKVTDQERYYKVAKTANEYIKKVKSNNYTIAVFGYEECNYCNLYLPVFNDVALKRKLEIYYFDRDSYDKDEYEKIMNLDLAIPKECTLNNQDTTFTKGFPKPMTVITKKGKLVGCIKGYVKAEELEKKLKEVGVLK